MPSLTKIDFEGMAVLTKNFPFEYPMEGTSMMQHGVFPNLFVCEGAREGKSKAITVHHTVPTSENIKDYLRLQMQINSCINNAEYIKSQLHIAVEYLLRHTFKARSDKQSFEGVDDFMRLKGIFLKEASKLPTTKDLIKNRPHGLNRLY